MNNPKTRLQLLESLYNEMDYQESTSDGSSAKKSVEMKDEGIQALDEEIDRYLKRNSNNEQEAKEVETEEEDDDDEE